jgi:hypothetical protein
MKFIDLLQQLEERFGYHQFPIASTAVDIKNIFEGSPLHPELTTRLIRAIYEQNCCRELSDTVTRENTFAALAPIRQEVLRSKSTDVDVYRLMEELCQAIGYLLQDGSEGSPPDLASHRGENPPAQIIELDGYRRQRRFKSWA